MLGERTLFRGKSKRYKFIMNTLLINSVQHSTVATGAIMMQNDPIRMKDDLIKSRKGLRT